MRNIHARFRKLRAAMAQKAIAVVWWGKQSEAELQTEIAEREAEASRIVVVSWQRW